MSALPPYYLEAFVLCLGVFLLLFETFVDGDKRVIAWLGVIGLLAVFGLSFAAGVAPGHTAAFETFYSNDALAMFFKRFALLTTAVVLIMAVDYLPVIRRFTPGATAQGGLGEFLALPVLTCAGLMWMASAVDFVMIFVSLELVTISFYVLVSYTRRNAASLEAGVKYLILGALSTGFFVYGITWIFGLTGQTNLAQVSTYLAEHYQAGTTSGTAPLMFSFVLLSIALGFKIAAVPFQIWVPDVYQGAPTPITAFLSVGSKAAGFVVFMRVLQTFFSARAIEGRMATLLTVIAAATLIYGNLAALPQNNLKRLLAYSSIAHAGYLLIAVAGAATVTAGDQLGFQVSEAISLYLAAYLPMTLLAFMVMIVVTNYSASDDIADFNGLSKRSPYLAFAMLIAMASLAGVPFTAGFSGKFAVFLVAVQQKHYGLVGIGVVAVACGFYYYLRVVRAMYFQDAAAGLENQRAIPISGLTRVTIGALIVTILFLGVDPKPLFGSLELGEGTVKTAAVPVVP